MPRIKPESRTSASRIFWKRGRAYADFRDLGKWGGKLEALIAPGEWGATHDAETALRLSAARLDKLQALKNAHPAGIGENKDRLATFIAHHLDRLERAKRKPVSPRQLAQYEGQLTDVARFMVARGRVLLADVKTADVEAWLEELETNGAPAVGRMGGQRGGLSSNTRGRYLRTLDRMFRRAVRMEKIQRNPVDGIADEDRPGGGKSPTQHLERNDAALWLEALRLALLADDPTEPPLYPLHAVELLAGLRDNEAKGLELGDIILPGESTDYPRGVVIVRPNRSRSNLKTATSERVIPMPPQLAEILGPYLARRRAEGGPLAFPRPGSRGAGMLGRTSKTVDAVARRVGFPAQLMRQRTFRVTFATHVLSTCNLETGQPLTVWEVKEQMGHSSVQMLEQVYARVAKQRTRRPHLEYRWEEFEGQMGARLGGAGEPEPLAESHRAVLSRLLSIEPATAKARQVASGARAVGSYYYARDVLTARGLVERMGEGRGSRFRVTDAGRAVLGVAGRRRLDYRGRGAEKPVKKPVVALHPLLPPFLSETPKQSAPLLGFWCFRSETRFRVVSDRIRPKPA